jgi:hypothetical protein
MTMNKAFRQAVSLPVLLPNQNGRTSPQKQIPDAAFLDITKHFYGQVRVTPEAAAVWLGINLGNRRKRTQFVEFLVRQINGGEWQEDHPQPIVFSEVGRMIDGQHRLFAIVESGQTVVVTVLCGVRDNLREYLDLGISRTLEDRIQFSDDLPTNQRLAQIVSAFANTIRYTSNTANRVSRVTPEEAHEVFTKHRDGILFAASVMSARQRGVCRAYVMVALAEMFERDAEMAQEFGASLLSSDGTVQPARILRDYLLRLNNASGQAQGRDVYHRTITACKAALQGREIKVLRYSEW